MKSQPAGAKHLFRLVLAAIFCALPFLGAAAYLVLHVRQVDTLPFDEYRCLQWMEDGRGLLFFHRPLQVSGVEAPTEVWIQDTRSSKFKELGRLPLGPDWRLTDRSTERAVVLEASDSGGRKLALFSKENKDDLTYLEIPEEWTLLPTHGKGLFFASEESEIPFDQFVELEAAPEVKTDEPASELEPDKELEYGPAVLAPTHKGIKIARYQEQDKTLKPLLSIPFTRPEEKPEVLLIKESPDGRFLALVLRFGTGAPGLWIRDSQNSKLLWTRMVAKEKVMGLDWSPDSVSVALTDSVGVLILKNALEVESVRYKASDVEGLRPHWGQGGVVLLSTESSVYKLDRDEGKAQVVFDSKKFSAREMVVDPSASTVAYFSAPQGVQELLLNELSGSGEIAVRSALPGSSREAGQDTLEYHLGSFLSHAASYWGERLR